MGLLSKEKDINGQRHILAYITPDEAGLLQDMGGQEIMTKEGIPAYPPRDQSYSPSESYGGPDRGDVGGDVHQSNEPESYGGPHRGDVGGDAPTPTGPDRGDVSPTVEDVGMVQFVNPQTGETEYRQSAESFRQANQQQDKNIVQKSIDLYMKYGMIPNAFRLGKAGLEKLGEFSSDLQAKAMTWSLENRIKSQMKNLDLNNPNSMNNPKLADLQIDLQGIKDGTFTQTDFTAKYGSGDAGNPLDKNYDPNIGGDRQYQNLITPYASYAVAGQTPVDSMVNKYFSNLNNSNLGISSDYLSTYNAAKANISNTLNMTPNTQQYGYGNTFNDNYARSMTSANPFFDELTNEGLI
tara:strand:+ start:783 stop:1838 length:1056 start_codon:yes stop_codon:yes gene_type:complete